MASSIPKAGHGGWPSCWRAALQRWRLGERRLAAGHHLVAGMAHRSLQPMPRLHVCSAMPDVASFVGVLKVVRIFQGGMAGERHGAGTGVERSGGPGPASPVHVVLCADSHVACLPASPCLTCIPKHSACRFQRNPTTLQAC